MRHFWRALRFSVLGSDPAEANQVFHHSGSVSLYQTCLKRIEHTLVHWLGSEIHSAGRVQINSKISRSVECVTHLAE